MTGASHLTFMRGAGRGHLHITLVAKEDVWAILIIEDRFRRHTITWPVSVDDLLSLREEKE